MGFKRVFTCTLTSGFVAMQRVPGDALVSQARLAASAESLQTSSSIGGVYDTQDQSSIPLHSSVSTSGS